MSDSAVKQIQELIKNNEIFVASKSYCPYCRASKKLLEKIGAKYYVIELDEVSNGSDLQAALEKLTGQRTVPNIFIHGNHIGGNDSLQALNSTGKLEALIKSKV